MNQDPNKLDKLSKQLDLIAARHEKVRLDMVSLREEFVKLKSSLNPDITDAEASALVMSKELGIPADPVVSAPTPENEGPKPPEAAPVNPAQPVAKKSFPTFGEAKPAAPAARPKKKTAASGFREMIGKAGIEKFIGTNIISIVGVIVTLIGVGIGVQYAIENELINPLTRIVIGYILGGGLIAAALKLKKKYHNFSGVILSGGLATMYGVTYAAYSFFDLIPQPIAFGMMAIFTLFTVGAAWKYNLQVIAHIGLVGAYAVPLLLSNGGGQVAVLFSYVAILNIGILIISLKKYWQPLYWVTFGLTWIMFSAWAFDSYVSEKHFGLALGFAIVFFLIFYATFLAYKLMRKSAFGIEDVVLLLTNSFIFFGMGYYILNLNASTEAYMGLFALSNAVLHFGVSTIVYRLKMADRNLFYLIAGLVLVFITIAVPIQLDGNWVTLIWASEAALMFWIGRSRKVAIYELLSYPLMILGFLSMVHDWENMERFFASDPTSKTTPFFNVTFLTTVIISASYAFINWFNSRPKLESALKGGAGFVKVAAPILLLLTLYIGGAVQVFTFWENSIVEVDFQAIQSENFNSYMQVNNLRAFKWIWIVNYTLFFLTGVSFVNVLKWKQPTVAMINFILNALTILIFMTMSLWNISELRESYLDDSGTGSIMFILIRYISIGILALNLASTYQYIKRPWAKLNIGKVFGLILAGLILWLASSEVIQWMDILANTDSNYRIGLTLLWGAFAVFMIIFGMEKDRKEFRVAAMVLLAITLLKLFYFDIQGMSNIAKTMVLILLGGMMMGASFIYNRNKKKTEEIDEK